ncbi:hypothetical protein [Rossellomorea vietnamensis]|uniref:hypothetical protein n=1 Tax=Rossellomorea vietnamensis TaxID=218284 RepID=UPI000B07E4DF|nr:hypothetical protein [Rossellomorea vietnamensis]
MNFNQKLRDKMERKGPEAAKKWQKRLEENALKYDPLKNQRDNEVAQEFNHRRSLLVSN